jgi:hypothetical protein
MAEWVKEFIKQVSQERFWEARNAAQFTLNLRRTIALLSKAMEETEIAVPKVKITLEKLVYWKSEAKPTSSQ